jgi:hypothetical protein
VVVDPGQDLGVAARAAVGAGEPVMGEVGLPGLVRLVGFEADGGGLGALVGLGDDQPKPREVAGDGGDRDGALMVVSQLPGDGVGSGVESLAGCLRSRTISSTTSSGIAVGEVFGRRERGSNAASPSAS